MVTNLDRAHTVIIAHRHYTAYKSLHSHMAEMRTDCTEILNEVFMETAFPTYSTNVVTDDQGRPRP